MPQKPVLVVAGATGAQGGGLVRAARNDPARSYEVRALTRDPGSAAARTLLALGAEVVAADVDDPESLERAFAGADAAFCVTFFWHHLSPEKEMVQAANLAAAARKARVGHVLWSTGRDGSAADALFADLPTTYLRTSFYWDNFVHFSMGPRRGADGTLVLTLPMGERPLPGIAAEDIGACALALFQEGARHIGQRVGIAGEHLTGCQMADRMGRALGEEVRYHQVPPAVYRSLGFPGAEELGNLFQLQLEHNDLICAARPVDATRALHPALQTFDDWLSRHGSRIPTNGENPR